jgi:sec-independent protein translocase protein TatC
MSTNIDQADDLFADTRMSFGDHLEALRWHLWRAIFGFVIAVCLCLSPWIGRPVLAFIAAPVSAALMKFYDKRVADVKKKLKDDDPATAKMNEPVETKYDIKPRDLARALGLPNAERASDDWTPLPVRYRPVEISIGMAQAERMVIRPPMLSTLTITEGFVVYLEVAFYCGIVFASPWVFYQIWSFIAAGLYSHEKRLVNVYLPVSLALFLGGVVLCEFLVMPVAVEYLLSFNEWLGLEPDLRLSNWLSFAIMMPVIFGVAFQTPLVMFILCRLGIVEAATFARWRRYAIFGLACLAAILSASPDLISFGSLAIPLCLLYEVGIILCRFVPPAAPEFEDTGDEDNPLGV